MNSPLAALESDAVGIILDSCETGLQAPDDWKPWLKRIFPRHFSKPFAEHHDEFWRHVQSISPGKRPRPIVAIWARDGGKSTNVEAAVAFLGATESRNYGLYVRNTQDQADKSVGNIGAMLESHRFAEHYPRHADRAVNKYGSSRGWRHNRLAAAGGLVVDAVGLDVAVRGLKFEERRPNFIIFDDIDDRHDTPNTTLKKERTIKASKLPAGSDDCAVLFVQNLIIPNGVCAKLADERADWLADRIVSGPHPAILDMKYEREPHPDTGRMQVRITAGTPTWQGFDLPRAESEINTIGLATFLEEHQHQVHERKGALWTRELLNRTRIVDRRELPDMALVAIAGDPAHSVGGAGDEIGIIGGGLGTDGHGYVWADRTKPNVGDVLGWGLALVEWYHESRADLVLGEQNFGGAVVEANVKVAAASYANTMNAELKEGEQGVSRRVVFEYVQASRNKKVRAGPVAALFQDGIAHIVGDLPELERELTGWDPMESTWSPNKLDAMVWLLTRLMLGESKRDPGFWFPGMVENGKTHAQEATNGAQRWTSDRGSDQVPGRHDTRGDDGTGTAYGRRCRRAGAR